MTPTDADRNLLFGVLALQGGLIDAGQFAEACTAWAARKEKGLADVLLDRGWLSAEDRQHIDYLLRRKLEKHAGDAHESLVAAASAAPAVHATFDSLRDAVADFEVRQTLADLCGPGAHRFVSTIGQAPEARDRYTLTRMHAKGGIGQVWLARDSALDREVALKEVRPEQAANARVLARFLQEARITGRLDHPGVVPIYEVARGDDPAARPYYTMRFIRGRTLKEAVADYHRLRAERRARRTGLLALVQAFLGVCNTVAYAHSRGVIHRDLKGQNIVLGDFGEVVLLDWGLAKLIDRPDAPDADGDDPAATAAWPASGTGEGMTVAGQALGTPAYMAPEQAEGRLDRIGRRTDIYGLGAILYEILAGRPPFDGESTQDVLRKVCEVPPEPPRRVNKKAPRPLEAICLKAMAKDPDHRYASAAEVAGDIQHWLADEPVSAWREPWATRARRWVSRNRTLVISGAAALVVAVAALSVLLAFQTRANRDLEAALLRAETAQTDASIQGNLAREAIQSFYSGISEDVILRRPELEGLRRRLLGTALSFYERLDRALETPAGAAKDTIRITDQARALERVASIQALLGDKDEAIRTRQKVVADYDSVTGLGGPPAAAEAVLNLANAQRMAGRPDDALRSYQEALKRYERLNSGGIYNAQVALTLADFGRFLNDAGRVDEGRRTLERAREAQEQLVQDFPNAPRYEQNLAATVTTLGSLHGNEGQWETALRDYEQANRLYEGIIARRGKVKDKYNQTELARSLNNLGLAQAHLGRIDEARRTLERGRLIREAHLADQPLNIEDRADLARSYYHIALVEALARSPAEALRGIGKAEDLYKGVPPKGPEDIYFQACLRAMRAGLIGAGKADTDLSDGERAERRRAADEAMERLKRAVASGYLPGPLLRSDPQLDPLRSRPDFQELLRSLERPKP
jgi:serine/threonine-protein kinase